MKHIVIQNGYYADIIVIPDRIAHRLNYYLKKFDNWIYDKSVDHKYWIYENDKKVCVEMGADVFVEYLNEFHIKSNEKAYVLKRDLLDYDKDLPILYF